MNNSICLLVGCRKNAEEDEEEEEEEEKRFCLMDDDEKERKTKSNYFTFKSGKLTILNRQINQTFVKGEQTVFV